MKYLPLTRGKWSIVDDEDYERLSRWKWYLMDEAPNGYAARTIHLRQGKTRVQWLHYEIMGLRQAPRPFVVDHINGDRLDNRRSNLRYATWAQNAINRRPYKKPGASSQYKGISYCHRRRVWRATLNFNNRRYHLGVFKKEYEAMVAYNCKVCQVAGEFAWVNHWTGPTPGGPDDPQSSKTTTGRNQKLPDLKSGPSERGESGPDFS